MWHARRGNVRSAGLHAQRAAHSRFGAGELVVDLDAGNGRDIRNLSGNVTLVFQGRQIPCSLAVRDGEVELVVQGATDECLNVSLREPAYVSSISRSVRSTLPQRTRLVVRRHVRGDRWPSGVALGVRRVAQRGGRKRPPLRPSRACVVEWLSHVRRDHTAAVPVTK